jgi:hypothetical protein
MTDQKLPRRVPKPFAHSQPCPLPAPLLPPLKAASGGVRLAGARRSSAASEGTSQQKAVGSVPPSAAPFLFWDGAGFKEAGLETRVTTCGRRASVDETRATPLPPLWRVWANEDGQRKAVGSVPPSAAHFLFWDGAGFKGAGLETRATTAAKVAPEEGGVANVRRVLECGWGAGLETCVTTCGKRASVDETRATTAADAPAWTKPALRRQCAGGGSFPSVPAQKAEAALLTQICARVPVSPRACVDALPSPGIFLPAPS